MTPFRPRRTPIRRGRETLTQRIEPMSNTLKPSRTTMHLWAGALGGLMLVGVWLRHFDILDGGLAVTSTLFFVAACFVMFLTRNADEYVAALWRAGTNLAFLTLLLSVLLIPFAEGFIDGLMSASTEDPGVQDLKTDLVPEIAFTGFFLAHFWARLRGTY